MRLELSFQLKESFITCDDRACVMSFLKFALEKKYPLIYESLYGVSSSKTFCFSIFLPGAKIDGDRYRLSDSYINVKISSSDNQLLMAIYNALVHSRFQEYKLPQENSFKLTKVSYSNTLEIKTGKVLIKFLSPLLVRDHDRETNTDRYLDYTASDFSEKLQIITQNYLSQRGFEKETILLKPVKAGRTVANCLKLKFNCSFGVFELTARPEVVNELYLAGMGSRRNEGFGLFDIIRQGESGEAVNE